MNEKCNGEVRAYKYSLPDGLYDFYIYTIKSFKSMVNHISYIRISTIPTTFTSPSPRKCMTTLWTISAKNATQVTAGFKVGKW